MRDCGEFVRFFLLCDAMDFITLRFLWNYLLQLSVIPLSKTKAN